VAVQIVSVEATELFAGTGAEPRQVLRAVLQRTVTDGAVTVSLLGELVRGKFTLSAGEGRAVVELPMTFGDGVVPGDVVTAELRLLDARGEMPASQPVTVVVAEPGWTMYLVSHFHYDPVWWNTQAGYTQTWELQGDDGTTRPVWENNAFHLVKAHLDLAAADPDYRFVLAEVDYLKPFWDVYPQYRALLRELMAAGRVEVMGGTYNEPNTNLTGLETTIRNLVYGIGYQRDIMGADPRTAWQLDVFGHDPQFPGLVADAGLSSTSWARGPYHQWGPMLTKFDGVQGDVKNMQFPAEFEWISPSGQGVVTHYMPNHYSAGWWMDSSATLEEAEEKVYELFLGLKQAAAARNTLLPVGTDYTPPNKWVTAIHRDWRARYVWPRFVTGLPRDFFAAVHAELAERGVRPSPQTRDMNPVYTGKDVSYIDTKQAQRAAETAATDAEKLATFASLLGYGRYPSAALDKVWRQLVYGTHHDAITGSESDQVYIDLVTGWREAHDLAVEARDAALAAIFQNVRTLGGAADGTVVVANTLAFERTDLVRVTLEGPEGDEAATSEAATSTVGLRLIDDEGGEVPFVVVARNGRQLVVAFVAAAVPAMGWRTWYVEFGADSAPAWRTVPDLPASIANEYFEISVDPARGGGVTSIVELGTGRQLLKPGGVGNELRVSEEYPQHPEFGEGLWHLVPNGTVVGSAASAASSVRVEESPIGRRYVVTGGVGKDAVEGQGRGRGRVRAAHHRPPRPEPHRLPYPRPGLHRCRPAAAREVPGRHPGSATGLRGRRRRHRPGLRAAGLRCGRGAVDPGQPGQHLLRARQHRDAGPRRRRGPRRRQGRDLGGRGGRRRPRPARRRSARAGGGTGQGRRHRHDRCQSSSSSSLLPRPPRSTQRPAAPGTASPTPSAPPPSRPRPPSHAPSAGPPSRTSPPPWPPSCARRRPASVSVPSAPPSAGTSPPSPPPKSAPIRGPAGPARTRRASPPSTAGSTSVAARSSPMPRASSTPATRRSPTTLTGIRVVGTLHRQTKTARPSRPVSKPARGTVRSSAQHCRTMQPGWISPRTPARPRHGAAPGPLRARPGSCSRPCSAGSGSTPSGCSPGT
jgi:hypothetical protein